MQMRISGLKYMDKCLRKAIIVFHMKKKAVNLKRWDREIALKTQLSLTCNLQFVDDGSNCYCQLKIDFVQS